MAPDRVNVLGFVLVALQFCNLQEAKTFIFPEYPYKETSKNVSFKNNLNLV